MEDKKKESWIYEAWHDDKLLGKGKSREALWCRFSLEMSKGGYIIRRERDGSVYYYP